MAPRPFCFIEAAVLHHFFLSDADTESIVLR